jgi:hypothetical protein
LWLIKLWFSASTFVVKIATFAKPENVGGKCIRTVPKQTDRQKNVNNLYTQTGVNEIQKRFDNLQSNAEKQWGKMDVA